MQVGPAVGSVDGKTVGRLSGSGAEYEAENFRLRTELAAGRRRSDHALGTRHASVQDRGIPDSDVSMG